MELLPTTSPLIKSTLLQDFNKLSKIIPTLKVNEVINFYEQLPHEKYENRMQHLLEHYYFHFGFNPIDEYELEKECKEIQDVLPLVSRHDIKNQLIMVGNIQDRKVAVIKQLLQQINYQKNCQSQPSQSPAYNMYNKVTPKAEKKDYKKVSRIRITQPVTIGRRLTISDNLGETSRGVRISRPVTIGAGFTISSGTSGTSRVRITRPVTIGGITITDGASETRDIISIPSTSYADDVIIDDDQNKPKQTYNNIVIDDDTNVTPNNDADVEVISEDGENVDFNKTYNSDDDVPSVNEEPQVDFRVYSQLMEIFPDASKTFLRDMSIGRKFNTVEMNSVISDVLEARDYPKHEKNIKTEEDDEIEMNFDNQYETLKEILPDADPTFLRIKLETFEGRQDLFKTFVYECLETKSYPTMKEYLRKQQLSAQMRQYTQDFSVENFLKIIPEPKKYFSNRNRVNPIQDTFSQHYAKTFLRNRYPNVRLGLISDVFGRSQNLWAACKALDKIKGTLKRKRKSIVQADNMQDIPLLQEIAYIEHQSEIDIHIKKRKLEKEYEFQYAKVHGKLLTCQCCYNDEILLKESASCEKQCVFCFTCIQRSVEIKFGEGKLNFYCLADCDSYFSLKTLQTILEPKIFSKIALKKQLEEVKAAGIEELEMCPFCDFATIPAVDDKIFHCLNPECMKESCRLCKEPSHIPLKCDEVEKDEDVKRRTFIENKMTEAVVRICYKCDKKFIKTEGCNKMVCECGAIMCYVCRKPVKDYKHFNGQGGDQYHLCPLFSDTDQLHKESALEAADTAKSEIGVELKNDPTEDSLNYYKPKRRKLNPTDVSNFLQFI